MKTLEELAAIRAKMLEQVSLSNLRHCRRCASGHADVYRGA